MIGYAKSNFLHVLQESLLTMEIKYQILEKEKILVQQFSGFFAVEDFQRYSIFIMSSPDTRIIKHVLIDIRNMEFQDDLEKFSEYIVKIVNTRNNVEKKDNRNIVMNHVFWVKTPLQTAAAQLFIDNFPQMQYSYYTSEKNILNTLSVHYSLDLNNIIEGLENTFIS